MDMQISQRAEHRIGPAQLLLAELVTLPVIGLAQRLDAELDTNPALELPQPISCNGCGLPLWRGRCSPCRFGNRAEHDHQAVMASLPAWKDPRARMLSDAAAALAADDRWIAEYLMADVDDHGLLADPLPVVAARLGCPLDRIRRVVAGLRRAGMPGLCAATLAERLRLQVAATGEAVPHEVSRLLDHGLEALRTDAHAAARAGGLTPDQVASALVWLRGHIRADIVERGDEPRRGQPVDVIVRHGAAGLVAETVAGPWSAVRVAPSYLAHADDPGLRPQVAKAARFVEVLARRDDVLTRVCGVVVARQAARILSGPRAHQPLSRRDVAAQLGVHESTVSRVVAHKHLLLPTGETVALASLFGSSDALRQCLRELVAGESAPQSDTELADALARRGHVVARRTIAKYRAELGIPHQRDRGGGKRDATPEPACR
jgi:RNA polymerase sigma-54 factor